MLVKVKVKVIRNQNKRGDDKMEVIESGNEKYRRYTEQMGRLKKSYKMGFFIESLSIEYAVMEDRLESALRHGGNWKETDKYVSIEKKIKKLEKIAENKKSLEHKYFSQELFQRITTWKGTRNTLIHAMMKNNITDEELQHIAEEGYEIVKILNSKVTSYNRKLQQNK